MNLFSLVAAALPATAFAQELQCNVPGECLLGELVGISSQESSLGCLEECKNATDCNFYTYHANDDFCGLFLTCPEISEESCPDCVSGELDLIT